MNAVVVIQARMGLSRLPGKVLMPLGGKLAIQQVVERGPQGWRRPSAARGKPYEAGP